MSLNPFTNRSTDPAELGRNDFIYAFGLHVIVFITFVILTTWHPHRLPEPPKSIQVRLISPSELKKEPPKPEPRKPAAKPEPKKVEAPKSKPKPKAVPKPKPKPKPKVKPKPKPKPKPKVKLKPKPKVKPKPRKKAKPKDDFDPFKPLVGTRSSQTSRPKKDLASVYRSQLSQKELDRYIQKIQEAVLQHWKVPANLNNVTRDPEVEMILNPDGSVRKLAIILSSGSPALDQSLIRAIEAAQPFVLPRKQFEVFRNNRIRFHPLR